MRGKGKKPKIGCKERTAFLQHRYGATKRRGIDFHFTYEEWLAWWVKELGPDWFEKRGRNLGQYVMARFEDKGPYASWNVKCILHCENSSQQVKNKLWKRILSRGES